MAKRKTKRWLWISVVLVLGLGVADYWLYPVLSGMGGQTHNRGTNGVWLRYKWYFGEHSSRDVEQLGRDLTQRQMRYAFFHVRSIQAGGSLKYRYPSQARALLKSLHRVNPTVKAIAWVYVGNRAGEGQVDLSRVSVRQRMVQEAVWLTRDCGFDGVQWDYEICASGDSGLLRLLDETRLALSPNKLISVATNTNYPWPLGRYGWSLDYFGEVGRRCDVLAVMGYDSGAYTPRMYVSYIRRQVRLIPPTVHRANPRCTVLMGLPTYAEGLRSHNPHSENLLMGLKAVRSLPGVDGVALFADYTTDAQEWADYDRWWLGR
jgi:hypothetical protein